jgi:hypothetical protein
MTSEKGSTGLPGRSSHPAEVARGLRLLDFTTITATMMSAGTAQPVRTREGCCHPSSVLQSMPEAHSQRYWPLEVRTVVMEDWYAGSIIGIT